MTTYQNSVYELYSQNARWFEYDAAFRDLQSIKSFNWATYKVAGKFFSDNFVSQQNYLRLSAGT